MIAAARVALIAIAGAATAEVPEKVVNERSADDEMFCGIEERNRSIR
jgi:hypothetical protein